MKSEGDALNSGNGVEVVSLLRMGSPCCRARAAIQASLAGMGVARCSRWSLLKLFLNEGHDPGVLCLEVSKGTEAFHPRRLTETTINESAQTRRSYLRAQGIAPRNIAILLEHGQPWVARLIQEAKKRKILLEPPPRFNAKGLHLKKARLGELKNLLGCEDLQSSLQKLSRGRLKTVRVFESTSDSTGKAVWRRRREQFAEAVWPWLLELVNSGSKTMCVAWGEQLSAIVSAMRDARGPRLSDRGARLCILPARGDPISVADPRITSTAIAAELAAMLGGSARSLSGVLAVISTSLNENEISTLKRFFARCPVFHAIFGTGGLIGRVDTILTGVGVPYEPSWEEFGVLGRELLRGWEVPLDWLRKSVLGDIAGVFVPKRGVDSSTMSLLAERQRLWLGLEESHIAECAKRAAANPRSPGVIVVTIGGKERALLLVDLVRRGLINHLVVDFECFKNLSEMV